MSKVTDWVARLYFKLRARSRDRSFRTQYQYASRRQLPLSVLEVNVRLETLVSIVDFQLFLSRVLLSLVLQGVLKDSINLVFQCE